MTAQSSEALLYKGEYERMATEPLEQYLTGLAEGSPFKWQNTACWRGYIGNWELREDKLYLTNLSGHDKEDREIGLDYLFPNHTEKFADWFTGEVRL